MWSFLSEHPWWGLTYLLIVCFTVSFVAMVIGSAIGSRRPKYLSPRAKGDNDVVH